ncbi:CLUMA_CG004292, isoform A [Clunio marinus]|uniref:CLUMA_CG004292, isoform A n=1 Tax=Clunio marinus TaxID=568069 RepID=A0A1J1HVQ9_9DIPT|nr:CLUMA_CG004292, isoform A [Clunio marinus]
MVFQLKNAINFPFANWEMAKNDIFTDFEIHCKRGIFKVHKIILYNNCSKLREVLATNDALKMDFPYRIIEKILQLIYSLPVDVEDQEVDTFLSISKKLELNVENLQADVSSFDPRLSSTVNENFEDSFHDTGFETEATRILPICIKINKKKSSTIRDKKIIRRKYPKRRRTSLVQYGKFCCSYCPNSLCFQGETSRNHHEDVCTFNESSRNFFRCDKCGKEFFFKHKLENHVNLHLQPN